ncbi:helix-turn-helix transcriptional regulator [Vandammella animalimorsus]|nr:AraC family transcriptional regulator [Vandammella animalimorsus]
MSAAKPDQPFDQMLRHVQHCLLLPDALPGRRELRSAFVQDGVRGHLSIQEMPQGLALGSLSMQASQPLCLPGNDGYHAPLTLMLPLAGQSHYRGRSGAYHQVCKEQLHWGCGRVDCVETRVSAGPQACGVLAAPLGLLQHWLESPQGHDSERRLRFCLHHQDACLPMQHMPMSEALRQDAARLLALQLAWRERPDAMTLVHGLQLEGLALAVLGQWLQLPPVPLEGPGGARLRQAVERVLEIIHAEYARPLSIAELARRGGINECYLKRAFKARTGMGVAAYLRRCRMQQAAALLEEGHAIQQVAQHVGYASYGHFARAFRQAHGHLPSAVAPRRLRCK